MKKTTGVFLFILFLVNSYSLFAALSVTSVSPAHGDCSNENWTTLQGSGFNQATEVLFGSLKAPYFSVISDSLMKVQVPIPKVSAGNVHVKVGNSQGRSPEAFNNRYVFTHGDWVGYITHGLSASGDSLIPFKLSEGREVPEPTALDGFSYGLAISQNSNRLYATSSDYIANHKIVILDIAKNQLINQISLSAPPVDIAINSNGQKGYVIYGAQLAEINLLNSKINFEMGLPYDAARLIISPDNKTGYVTHYYKNGLSVVDLESRCVIKFIKLARPYALAIHPNGKTLYVCTDNKIGYCIETTHYKTIDKFHVSFEPYSIAINPNGKEAYIANFAADNVSVLNLEKNYIACNPISVGKGPISIAVTPDGKFGYVVNYISGTVTPIDLIAHKALEDIKTGEYPYAIVITPDQSPIANFTATLATPVYLTVNFDASASITPVGEITKYTWIFENNDLPGSVVTTPNPTISHTFSTPGFYSVTLTVTNSAGTSTTQVFTGNTMSRNGSSLATTTKQVSVPWPPKES